MLALVTSACGSTTATVDVSAPAAAEDVAVEAETADEAAAEDATVEPEAAVDDAAETTTTTPESTLLPSGRERILANHTEGKPYVLWYWGAH